MPDATCPCTTLTSDSNIKVEENGKKAVFRNTQRTQYRKVALDGCLVKGTTCADWLVVKNDTGSIVIELKGRDVDHALDQVEAAISYAQNRGIYPSPWAALIVCTGRPTHPAFTTKLQRVKERFMKKFRAPIHIVCGNYDYDIGNVLSFRGPHSSK
jgi:hypothetical protein